ncbi:MAG: hypothetical protein OEY14_18250, partial [Myxococcales bacterium]|nr:hypothetical protein [Myxococcales bacterium]
GGSVVIQTAGGTILDLFAWGTALPANSETAPFAPLADPCASLSCERKALALSTAATMSAGGADELSGNGHDSGDNAADFVQVISSPQNLLSPPEFP